MPDKKEANQKATKWDELLSHLREAEILACEVRGQATRVKCHLLGDSPPDQPCEEESKSANLYSELQSRVSIIICELNQIRDTVHEIGATTASPTRKPRPTSSPA